MPQASKSKVMTALGLNLTSNRYQMKGIMNLKSLMMSKSLFKINKALKMKIGWTIPLKKVKMIALNTYKMTSYCNKCSQIRREPPLPARRRWLRMALLKRELRTYSKGKPHYQNRRKKQAKNKLIITGTDYVLGYILWKHRNYTLPLSKGLGNKYRWSKTE